MITVRVAVLLLSACAAVTRAGSPAGWPLKSSGAPAGVEWAVQDGGYIGEYVRLASAGKVEVSASFSSDGRVNAVIAGERKALASGVPAEFDLAAGTYLVRVETAGAAKISDVSVDGAEVLPGSADALALEAAEAYIRTGRQGDVVVRMPEAKPGEMVHLRQVRSAFHFGANASGAKNVLLDPSAPADSDAGRFQAFLPRYFNTVVPSNAGKWCYCEESPGVATMAYPDAILAFGKEHGLFARMHNLIWDTNQQPKWVSDLMDRADAAGGAEAKRELRAAISRRIGYYVRDRAKGYGELDVLNESVHKGRYLRIFGVEGVADIYAECARAIAEAGADAKTCVNEYNVLQYSQEPPFGREGKPDPYCNWYRKHVNELQAHGAKVGAIGVQYYADPRMGGADPHHAGHVRAVIENLATTGLPVTLTEFGIKSGGTPEETRRVMEESLRVAFGSPDVSGFLFFGFWQKAMWDQAPAAMLADEKFNLTPLGEAYVALVGQWRTETDAKVGEDGAIRFHGFYGDYELVAGDRRWSRTITVADVAR